MRRELRCVPVLCALSLVAQSCGDEPPRLKLGTAVLRVKGHEIRAEIARAPGEMARGLMYRRSLGEDCGMLFAYETPRIQSFWMKNTRIPLDIAFLDEGGRIIQVEEMRPYDELNRTVSREPARYALEMNRGWFAENGVTVGDRIEIPIGAQKTGHQFHHGGTESTEQRKRFATDSHGSSRINQ